jgi:hypothetical protein
MLIKLAEGRCDPFQMRHAGRVLSAERKQPDIEHTLRRGVHSGVFEDPGQLRPVLRDLPPGNRFIY